MSLMYHDTVIAGTPVIDNTPTAGSNHAVSSGGVKSAITHDLANIVATGATNTTGATISNKKYFYLNGTLVQAIADIAVNATFTSGTNYTTVTAGGLNDLESKIGGHVLASVTGNGTKKYNVLLAELYNQMDAATRDKARKLVILWGTNGRNELVLGVRYDTGAMAFYRVPYISGSSVFRLYSIGIASSSTSSDCFNKQIDIPGSSITDNTNSAVGNGTTIIITD